LVETVSSIRMIVPSAGLVTAQASASGRYDQSFKWIHKPLLTPRGLQLQQPLLYLFL
jgi:hypothetical protein